LGEDDRLIRALSLRVFQTAPAPFRS
jgi:hypothetical protein